MPALLLVRDDLALDDADLVSYASSVGALAVVRAPPVPPVLDEDAVAAWVDDARRALDAELDRATLDAVERMRDGASFGVLGTVGVPMELALGMGRALSLLGWGGGVLPVAPGEGLDGVRRALRARAADEARDREGAPLARATRDAYAADWRAWAAYCQRRGVEPLPVEWSAVNEWLVESRRLKSSTLRRRVAALSVVAQRGGPAHLVGRPGPLAQAADDARPPASTRNVLAHLARESAPTAREKRAAPILARHLRQMVDGLGDDAAGRRDRALLLLGWFGCLRPSEIAAARWSDLSWKEHSVVVHLAGLTKTDADGRRGEWVELPAGMEEGTCPLRALRAWRDALGAVDESAPILRAVDKGGRVGRPLSRHAVAARIATLAERAGLGHLGCSGHSLRRGAVTEAVGAGVAEVLVRGQSRHRSAEVFSRYVAREALPGRVATAGLL